MAVTIAEIQKLRTMTGAGMMDCKKALEEAGTDMEKAIELIRKRGQAIAAKRSDREAAEGCVVAKSNGNFAALLALKCETDFVAKNEDFVALTKLILDAAIDKQPANIEELRAIKIDGRTIEELVTERSGVTGEKMSLDDYFFVKGATTTAYIHPGNKLATIAAFAEENAEYDTIHGVAMQIAAMSPIAIDETGVPQEVKDREMSVAVDKTKAEQVQKAVEGALRKAGFNLYIAESEEHLEEGIRKGAITEAQAEEIRQLKAKTAAEKEANLPEQMIQNIANGRMAKFYKENTLLEQKYIMDESGNATVKDALKKAGITCTDFKRFTLNQE